MQILQITAGGGGGGGVGGGGWGGVPRPQKDVAGVGKIRFGVELVFRLVVFRKFLYYLALIIRWRQREFLVFFFLTTDFTYNSHFVVDSKARFRRRSTHVPNLTDELSRQKSVI